MFETEQERNDFCKKFNITEEKLKNSMLSWSILNQIAEDYEKQKEELVVTVKEYADEIQLCTAVHSLNYRVKDTYHLIEKVIRKNPKYTSNGDSISKDNYKMRITDLMGIRILLLFKEDWLNVHDYLMEHYEKRLIEMPIAHICRGDRTDLYKGKVEVSDEKSYRSVHYVIRTDSGLGIEIQVRTLYEEAWGEIDHKLRYPYNITNSILNNYIDVMSKFTGVGDEMGSFISKNIRHFQEDLFSGVTSDNEVYQYIIDKIKECSDIEIQHDIVEKIKKAENYKKFNKLSGLLDSLSAGGKIE